MVSVLCLPAAANAGPDAQISRLRGSALVAYPPSAADEVRFSGDADAPHDRPGPAVAAATMLTIGAAAVPASAGERVARVTGSAEFTLPFSPDNDVRKFTFDVRAAPLTRPFPQRPQGLPMDATGTVWVSHYVPDQNITVTFEAAVDCMITTPGFAGITAIVTRADDLAKDMVGRRVGLSVQDGGRGGRGDRLGYTWQTSVTQDENGNWAEAKVGTCMILAPFGPVTKGDVTVRHAELKPDPKPAA